MDYHTWSAQVLFRSCTLKNRAVKKKLQIRCPTALRYNSKYVLKALRYRCSHRQADASKGKEEKMAGK